MTNGLTWSKKRWVCSFWLRFADLGRYLGMWNLKPEGIEQTLLTYAEAEHHRQAHPLSEAAKLVGKPVQSEGIEAALLELTNDA